MTDTGKRIFDDLEGGSQPYAAEDIPQDRELVTTPYDAPVRTLAEEITRKELIVNPDFQRMSVWDSVRKSRLIESLLLNVPIPVCYFAEDEDGKRVVVDGQQRLRSIEEYRSGTFKLTGLQVLSSLNGKRWADLSPRQTRIIDGRTIRCIVISAKSDPNIRFEVFERLNTGGVPLNDQELRNCVYRGNLNRVLNTLAHLPEWLALLKRKEPDVRLRHHELILRYFAVKSAIYDYKPPLKRVLNDFMRDKRYASEDVLSSLEADFRRALKAVSAVFGPHSFRKVRLDKKGVKLWDTAVNRALYDVEMIVLETIPPEQLVPRANEIIIELERLCLDDHEFVESITRATADRSRTYRRFNTFLVTLNNLGLHSPLLGQLPGA